MNNSNSEYTYERCPNCGHGKSLITRTFMVPDGYDDVDYDFEEWCANPNCPSNKIINSSNNMKTTKSEVYKIDTKNFKVTVDFDYNNGVKIAMTDTQGIANSIFLYDKCDEQISELYDIFREIYRINQGE